MIHDITSGSGCPQFHRREKKRSRKVARGGELIYPDLIPKLFTSNPKKKRILKEGNNHISYDTVINPMTK